MNREYLLKHIAEVGYNVGFGAKKHFATYDMVSKVPGLIGLVSAAVGVLGLVYEPTKGLSATFTALGFVAYYVSQYEHKREEYSEAGAKLTECYNDIKKTYLRVKSTNVGDELDAFEQKVDEIEKSASKVSLSEQIVLSDWYAHYKFFWQHQIGWMDEELKFKLFRDKLPLSLVLLAIVSLVATTVWLVLKFWV
ncbi:SLATT domain-containing protein [Celeribacter sp.]|uniref:SLATT domain-containing protein n=1 Tax=Pseudomonadati TaxID=3379134 RepID=UPI003A92DEB0